MVADHHGKGGVAARLEPRGIHHPDSDFLKETAQWFAKGGGDVALTEALPQLYDELRAIAGGCLREERRDHTLQPTALVHEAYLRLREQRNVNWDNRPQFLAIAARMMRRILVDYALARKTAKRGGGSVKVSLDDALQVFAEQDVSTLALHDALQDLEALDPRQAQVVEMRFFGGLTVPEIGEVLSVSPATVKREWNIAKHWLGRKMAAA
ncbi:MAG TPA: sigma-70 family RNA polymerase sigma factor [Chthoniobacterales bacterium]|jgi:RNA polymerase sigma factor (TIGR02999 family)|nr:sigma-70 family RNA polymerase sigma factor [Chthoniobacterales bacterium]